MDSGPESLVAALPHHGVLGKSRRGFLPRTSLRNRRCGLNKTGTTPNPDKPNQIGTGRITQPGNTEQAVLRFLANCSVWPCARRLGADNVRHKGGRYVRTIHHRGAPRFMARVLIVLPDACPKTPSGHAVLRHFATIYRHYAAIGHNRRVVNAK